MQLPHRLWIIRGSCTLVLFFFYGDGYGVSLFEWPTLAVVLFTGRCRHVTFELFEIEGFCLCLLSTTTAAAFGLLLLMLLESLYLSSL